MAQSVVTGAAPAGLGLLEETAVPFVFGASNWDTFIAVKTSRNNWS
jgi:hypothetical protein